MKRVLPGLLTALTTLGLPTAPAFYGEGPHMTRAKSPTAYGKPGSRSKAERNQRRRARRQRGKRK